MKKFYLENNVKFDLSMLEINNCEPTSVRCAEKALSKLVQGLCELMSAMHKDAQNSMNSCCIEIDDNSMLDAPLKYFDTFMGEIICQPNDDMTGWTMPLSILPDTDITFRPVFKGGKFHIAADIHMGAYNISMTFKFTDTENNGHNFDLDWMRDNAKWAGFSNFCEATITAGYTRGTDLNSIYELCERLHDDEVKQDFIDTIYDECCKYRRQLKQPA